MAQSTLASASLPAVRVENRQARLDAAIALFRSEASASGYVVEEVRLRLPVPDVDVIPRIIIAQQNSATTIPPTFPRSKHPRLLSPRWSAISSDHPEASMCTHPCSNTANGKSFGVKPITALETKSGIALRTNTGYKRTISGSVIFQPLSARGSSSKCELGTAGTHAPQAPQKLGPLCSIPCMSSKESSTFEVVEKEPKKIAFWKTVIGSERGNNAILRTAESTHKMRHCANGSKWRSPTFEEDTTETEMEAPTNLGVQHSNTAKQKSSNKQKPRQAGTELPEGTLHINGHSIPESHVQLLLSSATDISPCKKTLALKQATSFPGMKTSNAETKKMAVKSQVIVDAKQSRAKTVPESHKKQYVSKGRRDSSDRHCSSSSAARPFRCHKCPSSFDRDGHLRVHILAVHEKKRPFVCQVCDASFGHSSSLLRHVRTVHQASPPVGLGRTNLPSRSGQKSNDSGKTKSEDLCEAIEDDNEKHFRCSACGHTFHRVALLNRHVATRHSLQLSSPEKNDDIRNSP